MRAGLPGVLVSVPHGPGEAARTHPWAPPTGAVRDCSCWAIWTIERLKIAPGNAGNGGNNNKTSRVLPSIKHQLCTCCVPDTLPFVYLVICSIQQILFECLLPCTRQSSRLCTWAQRKIHKGPTLMGVNYIRKKHNMQTLYTYTHTYTFISMYTYMCMCTHV